MATKRMARNATKTAAKSAKRSARAPKASPRAESAKPESETAPTGERLLTLTEISKRANISMPTLQRYKKLYQSRIPSVGRGRKQRYLESSLSVFEELKNENIGRRGRPRKETKDGSAKPAGRVGGRAAKSADTPSSRRASKEGSGSGLLTLTQISKLAGVSYPTAVRYVRLFLDRLPHEGEGRRRRFYSGAVDVFNQLREEGGRGGQRVARIAGRAVHAIESGVADRIKQLEKAQQNFEKKLRTLAQSLQKFLE